MTVRIGGPVGPGDPRLWARLAGVWLVGALAAPLLTSTALGGLFVVQSDPGELLPVAAGLAVAALLAASVLAALEAATSADRAERVGALVRGSFVLVVGGVGWQAGAWVDGHVGGPLEFPGTTAVLGGAPFALAAALLVRGWVARAAAALAVLGTAAGVLLVVAHDRRAADDALLARFADVRDHVYVLDVPGYPVQSRDASRTSASLDPADPNVGLPGEVYQERTISLSTADGPFDCRSAVLSVAFGRDERPACVQEAPGLWYLTGAIPTPEWGCPCGLQQYVREDGGVLVSVGASESVPRELLREAVLGARVATDDDLRRLVDDGDN